jgi:MoaA/NifB/PqqE/SkfB family radical SAM enzyme
MLTFGYSLLKSKLLKAFNRVPMPSILIYFITYRCNLKCQMCSARTYRTDEELNTQQVKDLFDQLKSLQLVRITGGEPFMREDLSEIVKHIEKTIKPYLVHITTNGTLEDRIVDLVKEKHTSKLFISISLDALEECHEEIRGEGTFHKTFQTLENLVKLKDRYNFKLEVNQTITESGLDEADTFAKDISDMGLKINYQLARVFHPSIPKPTDPNAPDCEIYPPLYGNMDREKLNQLLQTIIEKRQDFATLYERMIRRYYITGVRNRLANGEKYPDPRCVSLYDHIRLAPDGNILICRSDLTVVGNAAKKGLRSVWYGERANELREVVDHCKRCWYACESIPNGIYTWDVFSFYLKRLFKKHN